MFQAQILTVMNHSFVYEKKMGLLESTSLNLPL